MEIQAPVITIKQLKKIIRELESKHHLSEETKVFLDTGWDSIQEIAPDALSVEEALAFSVEDPINGEFYGGFSLKEKAEKKNLTGKSEKVLIIRNLY